MNGKHILIIDGDPLQARVLTRTLRVRGFETLSVRDPAAAVARAAVSPPAYIVLEQHFHDTSGLAYIKPLRQACPEAKILVLTGHASVEKAVESIKLGAWSYLAKPAHAKEILAELGADAGAAAAEARQPTAAHPHSLDEVEWNHILRVLRENDGNVSAAARALRMHRRTLQRKIEFREGKSGRPLLDDIRAGSRRRRRLEKRRAFAAAAAVGRSA